MTGKKAVFRRCRKCGADWNVSCIEPGGKIYICPWCDFKMKQKAKGGGSCA